MSDNVEPLKLPLHPIIRTRLITLMGENETLQHEIEKLRAALSVAVDAVEHWASYASSYAQEKHDLAGDLQKLRAALGEKE